MDSTTPPAPVSKKMLWTGRIMAVPPVLMLLMSGVMKIAQNADVVKGFADWPHGIAVPLGIVEIGCTFIYLIPRTAILGAILLTGYLGGATATVVRLGTFGLIVMTVGFGVLLWGGLFLRDARLRALIPFVR